MSPSLTILLNNVRFRAFHGLYPEERKKGNDFVVNLEVSYRAPQEAVTDLGQTIDYASLFRIIDKLMQQPVDLLETLVQRIAEDTRQQFPQVFRIRVSMEKLNPPIDGFEGSAAVRFDVSYPG